MKGIVDSNALVTSRLTSTQDALGQIVDRGPELPVDADDQRCRATPIAVADADRRQGHAATMTAILNSSYNGEHIFAGINTDVQPINDFTAAGSPNKAAFDAGFLSFFGFTKNDPAAANITRGRRWTTS